MSKHKKPYDITVHRLREIEQIIKHRYGVLPDTDDVDIFLNQVACCQLQMRRKKLGQLPEFDDLVDRLSLWCERWAPETSIFQRRDAAHDALRRLRIDTADDCAAQLRLSYAERTRLGITTIGAFDVNKRERAKRRKHRKRIRDRDRQARKRAERGALPRPEYLARSLARTQPWKRCGIHRRTWERRRRRRQHDRADRHWPRAGRAAAPRLRPPSAAAKERGGRTKEPAQTPRNDASPSPGIESVLVGDAPASIAIDVRTNEEGSQ
ncbi:MAG TPA: hypothetical protein VER26_19100 [Xanthobacteraceae bacterium]|jgi:hypothetical protein|nr:hypothetical protein [Xanthobacteraceae bacterium]